MPFPLIPVIVGAVSGCFAAVFRTRQKKMEMTPERQRIYDAALTSLKDPEKMRTIASAFRKGGLTEQASMLEKRAALKELSPEVREKRRGIIKQALAHTDPVVVRKVAAAFDEVGSTGAAATLRRYAAGLSNTPVVRRPVRPTPESIGPEAEVQQTESVIESEDSNSGISEDDIPTDPAVEIPKEPKNPNVKEPMQPVKPPVSDRAPRTAESAPN